MHKSAYNNFEEMHFLRLGGLNMYFFRKAYEQLKLWKRDFADNYAVLLEGARRVGKSTIAEQFAKNEYKSYILIDFSQASIDVKKCFDDISDLDIFFLRLSALMRKKLYKHESVIIFDEVQLFPPARQAIKHLVKDGRYHYIETGSLISLKKNVKDILIPSEEMKISVYPMDYEEFCLAVGQDYTILKSVYHKSKSMGQPVHRQLMRDIRIYMAVGGMPQAVDAFIKKKDFSAIDHVKRQIIKLYEDDFKKIDQSGHISAMYRAIPAQLSRNVKRYSIAAATGRRKTSKTENLIYDLIDSKTVLPCYNTTDPRVSLSMTKDMDSYKLYIADTGLFVTLMFIDRPAVQNEVYSKLLSDKLPANLGYLYENVVAQIIAASGRELYYHTWQKNGSTHYHEIDFLISERDKISALEVKSSGTGKHESLTEFRKRYAKNIKETYILSQKDIDFKEGNQYLPIYLTSCLVDK